MMKTATTLLLVFLITPTLSLPEFKARIPNGEAHSRPGSGIICEHLGHEPCSAGQPRNSFGLDFLSNGLQWSKELCEKDSDGDGLTNGEELGDPCCEWSADSPTPLRQNQLSHPGDGNDDGAAVAPKCSPSPAAASPPAASPPAASPAAASPAAASPAAASPAAASPTSSPVSSPATPAAGGDSPTTPVPTDEQQPSESLPPNSPTTATPSVSPSPEDDGVCFPAHATVKLEDGTSKRMDNLKIGDRVHVGSGLYSDVFMFTHKIPHLEHEFITIRSGDYQKVTATLTLTKGHFLYVNGDLVSADNVRLGDKLELEDGAQVNVIGVECGKFKGLYNPQTVHGDLIVDGVRVSTYTKTIRYEMAHSMLAPLRALYRALDWSTVSLENGASKIAAMLP